MLKIWNKEVFCNIHHKVQAAIINMDCIQNAIDFLRPKDDLLNEERQPK